MYFICAFVAEERNLFFSPVVDGGDHLPGVRFSVKNGAGVLFIWKETTRKGMYMKTAPEN